MLTAHAFVRATRWPAVVLAPDGLVAVLLAPVMLLAMLLANPRDARAQSGGAGAETLLIVPPTLEGDARAATRARSDIDVVVAYPAAAEEMDRGRHLLEQARRAYVEMELEASLAHTRDAVVELESGARSEADFALLAEALLLRGMAELAAGRADAARESVGASVRLSRVAALDEGRYPPPVRLLYDEVRAEVEAEPAASITVSARPAGATLFLDGREQGSAPGTVYGTAGRHLLRVEALGYAPRTMAVALRTDGDAPLSIDLPAADGSTMRRQLLALDARRSPSSQTIAELARIARARRMVRVVSPEPGKLDCLVLTVGAGASARDVSDFAALVATLTPLPPQSSEGDADPSVEPPDEEGPGNDGFYARLFVAAAARGDGASYAPPMTDQPIEGNGGTFAVDVELGAGFAPIPGLNVGVSLLMLLGQTTLTATCPATVTAPCPSPTVGIVGGLSLFGDWYPTAHGGFHLGGGIGIVRLSLRAQSTVVPDRDAYGALIHLATGYDFWLADFLALGPFVRILGYRAQSSGVIMSGGAVTLGVTLVYQ